MNSKTLFISLFSLAALVSYTTAHAVIISAQGDGGKGSQLGGPTGYALGIDPSTPRNGAAVSPHQRDTTIFNQRSMGLWKGCGQTIEYGVANIDSGTTKLVQKGMLPQVSAGGFLFMVLHQITGSGNGPYVCGIDKTGAGTKFSQLAVTRQVPGQSPILNAISVTQFPFQVAMPSDLKCTGQFGGKSNICMIRCQNFAINGPYGGCVPVQVVPPQ